MAYSAQYTIKVMEKDGGVHTLPTVGDRDAAVNDAELARKFSWAKRVMVFKGTDRYGSESVQIAEMAALGDPAFPAEIPFETGAPAAADEENGRSEMRAARRQVRPGRQYRRE